MNAAAALQFTATAVLAGTPVQVYAVAVVDIAVDAIVHTQAAVVTVPDVPSLNVPATSNFAVGVDVPIPTFAPLPRMTVLDWDTRVPAPTAVALDIAVFVKLVSAPRNVLFDPVRFDPVHPAKPPRAVLLLHPSIFQSA